MSTLFTQAGMSVVVVSEVLEKIEYLYKCDRSNLSLVVRKPAFCMCENKDADRLRSSREAGQRLCFRYTDSAIPLLSKFEISML